MLEFALPADADLDELERRLVDSMRLEQGGEVRVERTWYDTFDWRLDRAGYRLVAEPSGDGVVLTCRGCSNADTAVETRLRLREVPRFAWDLPRSRLRDTIEELVDMRALIARATVRSAVRPLALRDLNDKVVLRLAIEQPSVVGPDSELPVAPRLQLLPLKGYRKAAKRALQLIKSELEIGEAAQDQLKVALSPLGERVGDYSSKPDLELEPTMRADAATKRICLQRLEVMQRNLDGLCRQVDTEFLHDFRVAVRRSRSALGRIRRVFPSPIVGRFQREFRWLGQLTGPARDLDVYLLQFDQLRQRVPESLRQPLEPLRPILQTLQQEAYRQVVAAVSSPRCRKLLTDWRTYLEAPVPKRSSLQNAERPVLDVAREEIWRTYRRALKDGAAITDESPLADFHELRKTCKKLRYLLEFFRSLFPKKRVVRLIDALKALQKHLGEIQDLRVQADFVASMSEQLHAEQGADTVMAVGVLVDQLHRGQIAKRRELAKVFGRFARRRNRKLARALFKVKARAGPGAA